MIKDEEQIIGLYHSFIEDQQFPCIGAKTALAKKQVDTLVVGDMNCPAFDEIILKFLYSFIEKYKKAENNFYSAAIIFTGPENITEGIFEILLWKKLQSLLDLDSLNFTYNKQVSNIPQSSHFSLSFMGEAFFIVGLHPGSSRKARSFKYPALVFNPHDQFEKLKQTNKFEKLKHSIRKRDIALSGSVNPMLSDHGSNSETLQYSGKNYDSKFVCPLIINHGTN